MPRGVVVIVITQMTYLTAVKRIEVRFSVTVARNFIRRFAKTSVTREWLNASAMLYELRSVCLPNRLISFNLLKSSAPRPCTVEDR